jgi:hypothetical protein
MEEQTCGRGLAENAVLPAQLAEVTEAIADNLQAHMQALELDDEAACAPWPGRWPPPATCPWAATTPRR